MRTGTATTIRQTILWTGVLAVIPLVAYPRIFGLGMFGFHPVFGLLEWGLYFAAFIALLPSLSMAQRVLASGFTVVYRLTCAAMFAVLAALNNDFGLADTIAVGMWSYPLAVLPHVIAAPLVMRGIWKIVYPATPQRTRLAGFQTRNRPATRETPVPTAVGALHAATTPAVASNRTSVRSESPSFDDAVSYVGGYTGVRMCWVVDNEGLPLAFWQRQDYTGAVEFWAPKSIELVEFNRRTLSVGGEVLPQHVEVRFEAGRLSLQAAGEYWIGLLTDRDADDLVGVRLTQAREMVLKHLQERRDVYTGLQEAHYV
jgi:hypothetical protein